MITKDEYIILYKTKNKTGKYSREKYLKKFSIEIYEDIIKFAEDNNISYLNLKQKIYHYVHDLKKNRLALKDELLKIILS